MFAYLPERGEASGYAVVTPRFVCLLGPEATAETARNVFWLLDSDDARLQDALGTLSHAEGADRFAIVELLDSSATTLHVSAVGDVTVGIDGATAVRASGNSLSTDASGVRSAWISLTGARPDGELLPLYRGIVRASGLVTEEPSTPVTAAAFAEADEKAEEPGANEKPEADEQAGVDQEPQQHEEPASGETPEQHEAEESAAARWVLQLPDGSELDADGTIIIGRDEWEEPREGDLIRHVAVPSPMKQISGDHLELALVGEQLVARDLDSTNGTIVITPEQAPRLLHGGDTTALQDGDILDLGESLRIVVGNRR